MYRMIPAGKLAPISADRYADSRLGIGFEKLDRDVFDPEKAYDKLAAIGVKWVRIQSGWQRTEKEKGVYDFAWIDAIVDNLLRRGLKPWVCLCYGNGLYTERAKEVFGAVGCPPVFAEEEKTAWHAYVRAFAAHFKGRVHDYEVWNEPDSDYSWKPKQDPEQLGLFTIDTARAVRESDPGAYVIGGAFCSNGTAYQCRALETGMADEIDAISFHEYVFDESDVAQKVRAYRAMACLYNRKLEIIQGESGAQSRSGGHGALEIGAWTQRKQAKLLLRHLTQDLLCGCRFTSYFSCMDMIEALNGRVGDVASYLDYGYFGVLGAEFDENGRSTGEYRPKQSYYALQNLASILGGKLENTDLPVMITCDVAPHLGNRPSCSYDDLITGGFKLDNGSYAYAYWKKEDLMTSEYEGAVTLEVYLPGEVRLVDPMDGKVYAVPEGIETVKEGNKHVFKLLPVRDYPMFLIFGEIPSME